MDQERMFVMPVEALTLQASWIQDEGWSVRFASRHTGDPWAPDCWTTYARLSVGELLDVICCEAANRLLES